MRHSRIIPAAFTDRGGFRMTNQDAILSLAHPDGDMALGICCDGIGGLERSEEASGLITDLARGWFHYLCGWVDPGKADADTIFLHFLDAAESWNERLFVYARENSIRTGTTFSGILTIGESCGFINVGDSRIYLFSPGSGLRQLTVDDTRAEMYDGRIKNYLTDFFGKRENLGRGIGKTALADDDMVIFCTDGYYHNFTYDDAADLYSGVVSGGDAVKLCEESALQMIDRGETDNISLGIIFRDTKPKSRERRIFGIFG